MSAINVTITGTMTGPDGVAVPTTLVGDLSITGLVVGGGPIIPDTPPPVVEPPPDPGSKPPLFVPVWSPDLGWVVVPAFPVPTPSSKRK